MHFRAALFGRTRHRQGRYARAAVKLHLEHFALTANGQPQPRGQGVDAGNAHAVQAARHLVRVLVELAARMQLGQDDFGSAAAKLVVLVDVRWNAPAVVGHRDRVIRMDGDDDLVAVPGQ